MYNLTQNDSFISIFENSVKENWNKPALDEFNKSTSTYGELAAQIEEIVLCWKAAGLRRGDKVTLNARSSANWGRIFFACQTGGFVAVQLFNGFTPADTTKLVCHSDSRILYTEKAIFSKMNLDELPEIIAVFDTNTGELLASRGDFAGIYARRHEIFEEAHPDGFTPADVHFDERGLDELSAIMYTSGSTGNPKGVMLSVRNFSSNIKLIPNHFPYRKEDNYVSVLPYAHIFGLVYDLITPLCYGMTLCVLGVPPVPSNLKPALRQYRPHVFFAVPLIINKMIDDTIGEFIRSKSGAAKLADYSANQDFCDALHTIFMNGFGGNLGLMITGGAAMPEQLEKLFLEQIKVPFVTGYGMTECAPTITLGCYGDYRMKECGKPVSEGIDLRIDSADPYNIAGEVLVRGDVVFSGYYKNPDATKAVMTADGWFRTGDLGTFDERGSLFLVGRCKSMILTSNGQNIFPEEIEVVLNQLPYVAESLIVERSGRLTALIVPNQNEAAENNLDATALNNIMASNIAALNKKIPAYSAVASFELQFEPFAKTPKGSIRRFMYA